MSALEEPSAPIASAQWFTTTHRTTVQTAGQGGAHDAAMALERLCHAYWYPLYG